LQTYFVTGLSSHKAAKSRMLVRKASRAIKSSDFRSNL
jgi:hypothetical protein